MTTMKKKNGERKKKTVENRLAKLEKISKQIEFKTNDQTASGTVTLVAGFVLLNGVSAGDLFNTRDGRIIMVKSIELSYTYMMDPTLTQLLHTQIRVMIIQDRQPNQVLLLIADLLDLTTMTSLRNLDNRSRFIVHYNKVHSMSSTGEQAGSGYWYKRFNVKTTYDNTGDLIADITTNAFFLVLFSTDTTTAPLIEHTTRMRYTDA